MTSDPTIPTSGHFDGRIFRVGFRVYAEDTDATGVVYHGRYPGFLERARTEMLRAAGISWADTLAARDDEFGYFAIRRMTLDFRRPARLDDVLLISNRLLEVTAAACRIRQTIDRVAVDRPAPGTDDMSEDFQTRLVEAEVLVAYLGAGGRPRRHPPAWRAIFQALVVPGAD